MVLSSLVSEERAMVLSSHPFCSPFLASVHTLAATNTLCQERQQYEPAGVQGEDVGAIPSSILFAILGSGTRGLGEPRLESSSTTTGQ